MSDKTDVLNSKIESGERRDAIPGMVSVVMSVKDTPEDCLRAAILSILNQTYRNFEFLIVDDGSNAATKAILREYEDQDARVRILTNERNLWLAASLNRGIREAKGEYVARMDSDDLSLPTRFERQVAFLEKYRDVDVLGTEYMLLEDGKLRAPRRYENQPWQIQGRLLFGCQGIAHPSVMIRAKLFADDGFYYDEQFRYAQDFELWTRVGLRHKIYVLPEPLLHYRVSKFQASSSNAERQRECRNRVLLKELRYLGIKPGIWEKEYHIRLSLGKKSIFSLEIAAWANKLSAANRRRRVYDPVAFEYYLRKRQLDSALHSIAYRSPFYAIKATFVAARRAFKATRDFRRECKKRGNSYAEF